MEKKILPKQILDHYTKQLPFVLYALPESEHVVAVLQKDDQLHTIEEFTVSSFVLAPFTFEHRAICIPEAESTLLKLPFSETTEPFKRVNIDDATDEKEAYIELVKKALSEIRRKNAEKIVVSRKVEIALKHLEVEELFARLFTAKDQSFRYLWYHPTTGIWCGATPEVLVTTREDSFVTMALAGTQPYSKNLPVYWGDKEITEQQFVTDAITNNLQKVTSVMKLSKTYTHIAGNVAHLRTDITGMLKTGRTTLQSLIQALHPTPAICGTPTKAAKRFIGEQEEYDRAYYTGFLGPICDDNKCSNLFVNLRCMKIENKIATIFVGGGITIDSDPSDEWEETRNKMQTMLQVLQPML